MPPSFSRRALLAASISTDAQPVFRTGVAAATKDKPQSKIWHAHGSWWAWLPVKGGSGIWKRTPKGWQWQKPLDRHLRGLPGQADVVEHNGDVVAVLVEPDRLVVTGFNWDSAAGTYQFAEDPMPFRMAAGIETATIARSADGRIWIAYNWGRQMWVRSTVPGNASRWSEPFAVDDRKADDDDICQIVTHAGGVGVIWSDQNHDAVYFRRYADGGWQDIETVARGGKTADDHLSTAVASDGTLYVATKNSVDLIGEPQLVLRVRTPQGRWRNFGYAPLTTNEQPTRPIALLAADQKQLHLFHTVGLKGTKRSRIDWLSISTRSLRLEGPARVAIEATAQINNVTGPKAGVPAVGGLVIASDNEGRIYEAPVP